MDGDEYGTDEGLSDMSSEMSRLSGPPPAIAPVKESMQSKHLRAQLEEYMRSVMVVLSNKSNCTLHIHTAKAD